MSGKKKISAIIACYKDGPAIPIMYERLVAVFTKIDVDYEIIFVNDRSPDDAREVLEKLTASDPKVVAINHSRNFGSQSGFTSGMQICTGDAVVLLDGDLQDPPEIIEEFHEKWVEGYEVVYGVRVKREATLFLQVAYKAFYRVFRATSYVAIPVDAGDFSLIDRKVVNVLNLLPETHRFVRGLRAWAGFKQIGVPYVRPERMFGVTTNSALKNLAWAQRAIVSFSYAPLVFITWLAFGTVTLSILAIIFQVLARLFFPTTVPPGFTTLICLIMFMGGIQLLCLAIVGAYLSHIYEEVKRRPAYIVESIFNDPRETSKKAGNDNGA